MPPLGNKGIARSHHRIPGNLPHYNIALLFSATRFSLYQGEVSSTGWSKFNKSLWFDVFSRSNRGPTLFIADVVRFRQSDANPDIYWSNILFKQDYGVQGNYLEES